MSGRTLAAVPEPETAPPLAPITAAQRKKAVALIKRNKKRGTVDALRAAGVKGTRAQIKTLVDEEIAEEIREARGWRIVEAEQAAWDVACDTTHPHWDRANARVLKAFHPAFREISRHELTGRDGGPMQLVAGRFDPDLLSVERLEQLKEILDEATPKQIEG